MLTIPAAQRFRSSRSAIDIQWSTICCTFRPNSGKTSFSRCVLYSNIIYLLARFFGALLPEIVLDKPA